MKKIESSHRQIGTGRIDMGIIRVLLSIRRCKDRFWAMATLFWNRGSCYTSVQSAGDFWYSPCTSTLSIQSIWYPFQRYRCRSGGAVTGFLFSCTKIQSSHHQDCAGYIDIGINRVLLSFWRCKDWIWAIRALFWNHACLCGALRIYTEGRWPSI